MPRYSINIQVSAQRLPDPPPPEPVYDPGKDPMHEMVGVLRESMSQIASPDRHFHRRGIRQIEGGAGMTKTVEISVESFAALAEILGKFDSLGEAIECSHPIAERDS